MDGAAGSHPAVGHSVLAPGGIAALVAAAYDVGRVERCLLVRTWVNDVYAVAATRGAYVAKVYRHGWRSEADVGWELALLAHLARHGASVAVALPRRDGGMTLPVAAPEGPRLLAVFEAAAGAPPRRPFTARLFHAYGRAAATLHSAARGFAMPGEEAPEPVAFADLNPWYFTDAPRQVAPKLARIRRQSTFEEVVLTLAEDSALYEARRCFSCGSCFSCDNCYGVCPDDAVLKPGPDGSPYAIDLDYCKGCGMCAAECPCGAIAMVPEQT